MNMEYQPKGRNKKIEDMLKDFDQQLKELRGKVEDLESSQTKWGRRLGEDISVPCPGCGKQHTIPYVPGRYPLCYADTGRSYRNIHFVIVKKDGTIETGYENV